MPRPRVAAVDRRALGLAIDQLVAWGALYYAYGVLAVPLGVELGLTTEILAAGASASLLVSAVLARAVGRAVDRGRAGAVMLAGAVIGGVGLGLLAVARGPTTLGVACLVLGVAQAASLYEVAFAVVVAEVPDPQRRARALLMITTVAGLASAVFVPLTTAWVASLGWRGATLALAGVSLAVALPLRLRRVGLAAPRRSAATVDDGPAPAAFSRLILAFAMQSFATTGIGATLLWQLLDGGASPSDAAWSVGLVGASQLPGRWLAAPLQRWVVGPWRTPALFAVHAASVIAIGVDDDALQRLALVAFGATAGLMTLERAATVLERGGVSAFGRRSGEVAAVAGLARAAGPWAVVAASAALGWIATCAGLAMMLVLAAVAVRAAAITAPAAPCPSPCGRGGSGARRRPRRS